MPDYRRYFVPGGTYFFTLVAYQRRALFDSQSNVQLLREAIAVVKHDQPFEIHAAVVLPDHLHFIWSLPAGDSDYSKRIGCIKVEFTKRLHEGGAIPHSDCPSRRMHRESDVWQRRFWEHTIDDSDEFEAYFNYVHFNPVKHGLASCPHAWEATSFHQWVARGVYDRQWGCRCDGRMPEKCNFAAIERGTGE